MSELSLFSRGCVLRSALLHKPSRWHGKPHILKNNPPPSRICVSCIRSALPPAVHNHQSNCFILSADCYDVAAAPAAAAALFCDSHERYFGVYAFALLYMCGWGACCHRHTKTITFFLCFFFWQKKQALSLLLIAATKKQYMQQYSGGIAAAAA